MRFTTLAFIVFFLLVYLSYWSIRGRARLVLIVVSSLIFYAAWSIPFMAHFLAILVINYFLIQKLFHRPSRGTLALILAIDAGNLFVFKYFYLFLQALHDVTGLAFFEQAAVNAALESATGIPEIFLPLAISFYTFQLMAYAVDVYRKDITELPGALEFMAFILFFPQLVAGPIMRHSDFFHQLRDIRPDQEKTISGSFLLLQGVIKKVLIADNVAPMIQPVFAHPEMYDWTTNLMAGIGFATRVYCDFSGYTDIARGLGKLLGLDLPENFRGPYLAVSMRDTWQRWHVTLSTWMRDYLYIPLGGSRKGEARNIVNLIITFTLAGLWHGAQYQYLFWGFLHGVLLAAERTLRRLRESLGFMRAFDARLNAAGTAFQVMRKIFMVTVIFIIWIFASIPFNAPGLKEAFLMYGQIISPSNAPNLLTGANNEFLAWSLVITYIFNGLQVSRDWHARLGGPVARYAAIGVLGFIVVALLGRYAPTGVDFIYFQF